jgi:flagellar biosynthesis protein FlhF
MRIKSYFAPAVEDAIAQARQELGDEAMLVKSRRSLPDARHLGEYEVIFAVDLPGESEPAYGAAPAAPAGGGGPNRLSSEIAELKRELEGMRRTLACSAFAPMRTAGGSTDAASAYSALLGAELLPELARELVEGAETRRSESDRPFGSYLLEEIESRLSVQPELGRPGRTRIVALVGPPGAGKTTTLIKLAVSYGLASRRPSLLLSMDTYRIAAADQLRSYAAILGLGCQVLETPGALAQAIEENGGKDLVFIDTPGLGSGDLEIATGLARLLSTRSDIDIHLVLPASMKSADMARAATAYEIFAPRKLDETGTFGPILNQAFRTGKSLSFFTGGQRIPEDLEAATRRRIIELVMAGVHPAAQPEASSAA